MTDSAAATVSADPDLAGLIAGLADNKYFLGLRYAEWCTAAPTLESAVAAAAMAQDEIGHARSFYPLLRDVSASAGGAGDPELEPETRTRFSNAPFLNHPFESWTDFVAANFLFDTALTVLLEAAVDSTFSPLAQRARRILEEEPLHWLHAEGWTRRLSGGGPALTQALENSLARVRPEAEEWFLTVTPGLVKRGMIARSAVQLRETFRQRVDSILVPTGLVARP